MFVYISTTHGVMKGTYTLLNPSAPLIWNCIRFCVDHSGYRGNLQRSKSRLFISPPQANTDQALRELYGKISEQETANPDAVFIIMGDFNKANFRTIAPKYFQHITINTRGDRVLDHCYSPSGTHTSPSPVHLSSNRITPPFCCCLLIGIN